MWEDSWLSERLKMPAFTLEEGDLVDSKPIQVHISDHSNAFYQAKIGTANTEQLDVLQSLGFRVVDVNIAMSRSLDIPFDPQNVIQVESARADHSRSLLRIAETEFSTSRFHLDPRISLSTANDIKRDWLHAYIKEERGIDLLVASSHGAPVGFLAVLEASKDDSISHVIDLIAVDGSYRNGGVGSTLVEGMIKKARGSCSKIEVGTQAANVQSLRFYEKLGFRIQSTRYVLHFHHQQ